MKNFKLLLATTAILSTGALIANAVDVDSFVLKTRVAFVFAPQATLEHELDFGLIHDPQFGDRVVINAINGSTEGSTTRLFEGTTSRGVVDIDSASGYSYERRGTKDTDTYGIKFSMPNKITLTPGDSNEVCGYVTDLHSSAENDIITSSGKYYIGGTFVLNNSTSDNEQLGYAVDLSNADNCMGQGTVTIVWDSI